MTLSEFKTYFKTELNILYTASECSFLYSIFIEKITGWDTYQQRKFSEEELLTEDEQQLLKVIQELKTNKPYQHILGETEFYGMKFFVDQHVLIPRPETEELLERAIKDIQWLANTTPNLKILDIGTGSGVIPIVLKKYYPEAEIYSIDYSENALKIAQKNASHHKLDIHFIHQDYLGIELGEYYDVIISNPPYIGIEEAPEIADSVKEFEPNIALFSPTSDPLVFYKKIAEDSKKWLKENGLLFLEINQKLGSETLALYSFFSHAQLVKDLSKNDRFIIGKK